MRSRRHLLKSLAAANAAAMGTALAGTLSDAKEAKPPAGNGVADTRFDAGDHRMQNDVVQKGIVTVMPGARIHIDKNRTFTVLGELRAGKEHIFFGDGHVDMKQSRNTCAFPEWWGAVPNDPATDCLPALEACVRAHPVISLGAGHYFISDCWKIETPNRRIWGAGKSGSTQGEGTRIVVDGDRDAIQVGTSLQPATVNAFLKGVDLRWLCAVRRKPAKSSAHDPRACAAGIRLRFVLNCRLEGVSSYEHPVGFAFQGAVRTIVDDCEAFCSLAGGAGEAFWGFHFDGTGDIGLAGGNASLYVLNSNASVGGPARSRRSTGAYLQGTFADTFLLNFETAALQTGILVDGRSVPPGERRRSGMVNLHLVEPVIDQCTQVGIELVGLSDYAAVDIVDPYIAPAAGATAAIHWHDSRGLASITDGQLLGWGDFDGKGNAAGILGSNADGLSVSSTKLVGFRRPAHFTHCRNLDFVAAINNPQQKTDDVAIRLSGCSRSYLRPRIKGMSGAFVHGVLCEGSDGSVAIEASGIDPDCVTSAVVQRDGKQVGSGLGAVKP